MKALRAKEGKLTTNIQMNIKKNKPLLVWSVFMAVTVFCGISLIGKIPLVWWCFFGPIIIFFIWWLWFMFRPVWFSKQGEFIRATALIGKFLVVIRPDEKNYLPDELSVLRWRYGYIHSFDFNPTYAKYLVLNHLVYVP